MQLRVQGWKCSWNCLQKGSSGTSLWVCEQKRLVIASIGFLPSSIIGEDLPCHYWETCGLIALHSGVTFSVLKLDLPAWLRRLNFQIQVSSSLYHASHHFPSPVFDWQLSSETVHLHSFNHCRNCWMEVSPSKYWGVTTLTSITSFASDLLVQWLTTDSPFVLWREFEETSLCMFLIAWLPSEGVRSCKQQMPSDCQEESCRQQSIVDRTILYNCHCLAMDILKIPEFYCSHWW